jgi:hypothetical protein
LIIGRGVVIIVVVVALVVALTSSGGGGSKSKLALQRSPGISTTVPEQAVS